MKGCFWHRFEFYDLSLTLRRRNAIQRFPTKWLLFLVLIFFPHPVSVNYATLNSHEWILPLSPRSPSLNIEYFLWYLYSSLTRQPNANQYSSQGNERNVVTLYSPSNTFHQLFSHTTSLLILTSNNNHVENKRNPGESDQCGHELLRGETWEVFC